MPDAFNPDLRHRRTGEIAQQYATQGITKSNTKAVFHWLSGEPAEVVLTLYTIDFRDY